MAYGGWQDYQELSPGIFSFSRGDGKSLTLSGDSADQLKQGIDRSRAVQQLPFDPGKSLGSSAYVQPEAANLERYAQADPDPVDITDTPDGNAEISFARPRSDAQSPTDRVGVTTVEHQGDTNASNQTNLSRQDVSAQIAGAYERKFGRAPSPQVVQILTAQSQLETNGGKNMFDYNFGGIKGKGTAGSNLMRTREGGASDRKTIQDKFARYNTPEEGADAYVSLLYDRYQDALLKAENGDVDGYASALKRKGYYTADESEYAQALHSRMSPAESGDGAGALTQGEQEQGQQLAPGMRVNNGNIEVYQPGVSPEQLAQSQGSGVALPQAATTSITKGLPGSAEYLAGVGDIAAQRQQNIQTIQTDLAARDAESERMFSERQVVESAGIKAEQEKQQRLEGQVAHWDQEQRRLSEETSSAKIDPGRVFKGAGGTMSLILSTVAVALGAIGASFSRGPNYALQIVEGNINRDVAAQENDIARKGAAAQNALSRYRDAGFDLRESRQLLKADIKDHLAGRFEQQAERSKNQQVKASYADLAAQIRQQALEQKEATRLQALDRIQTNVQSAVQYPTAGGYQAPSGTQQLDLAGKVGEIQKGEAQRVNIEADTALKLAEAKGGGKKNEVEKRAASAASTGIALMKELARASGTTIDENGNFANLNLNYDLPGGDMGATGDQKSVLSQVEIVGSNLLNSGAEIAQPSRKALGVKLPRLPFQQRDQAVQQMAKTLYREARLRGVDPNAIP